jgi:hypothetical protein
LSCFFLLLLLLFFFQMYLVWWESYILVYCKSKIWGWHLFLNNWPTTSNLSTTHLAISLSVYKLCFGMDVNMYLLSLW